MGKIRLLLRLQQFSSAYTATTYLRGASTKRLQDLFYFCCMRETIIAYFLIFLATSVIPITGEAQSLVVDSLKTIIEKSGTPNGPRIETMERLSKIMAAQNKLDDALTLLARA